MPCLKTERIGIFGGAFDPPHKGHVRALQCFLDEVKPDRVYVVPSGKAPHKVLSGEATNRQRLEMAREAFLPVSSKVKLDESEISSLEVSYTYQTVERIRARHPQATLFLFIGTDQFLSFETWKNVPFLVKECTLCAMARYENDHLFLKQRELEKEFGAQCLLLREKAYIISSTEIRSQLKKDGFSSHLPAAVNQLIAQWGIYGSHLNLSREQALKRIGNQLSPERYSHSLSVERETVALCRLLGVEESVCEELRLAALYHDLTKEISTKEQLLLLRKTDTEYTAEDLESPAVLHGISAAALLKKEGVLSPLACSAIRYHTTGKANMTLEEKILCFADVIEETRPHEVCRKLRNMFYTHLPEEIEGRRKRLDECLICALQTTVSDLQKRERSVHPLSRQALEYLEETGKEAE